MIKICKIEETPYIGDPIQNNLKYNIPNILGKYNRMVIPSMKWKKKLTPQDYDLSTKIYKSYYLSSKWIINVSDRYSHKLRWYNITLQEKGFPINISDVLDTSNINGVVMLNTLF
ncbi:hypothetical protein H8356DRAFT_1333237 [Neocallimastix lanati (nom. inval.)]|nr:hypothetical protein H8356DRAFT_1333237 [Neocallimastix sp. JGI-2020a]